MPWIDYRWPSETTGYAFQKADAFTFPIDAGPVGGGVAEAIRDLTQEVARLREEMAALAARDGWLRLPSGLLVPPADFLRRRHP